MTNIVGHLFNEQQPRHCPSPLRHADAAEASVGPPIVRAPSCMLGKVHVGQESAGPKTEYRGCPERCGAARRERRCSTHLQGLSHRCFLGVLDAREHCRILHTEDQSHRPDNPHTNKLRSFLDTLGLSSFPSVAGVIDAICPSVFLFCNKVRKKSFNESAACRSPFKRPKLTLSS